MEQIKSLSDLQSLFKKQVANKHKRSRKGKIVVNGDNLTTCGNPYALLLYSVGEDFTKDPNMDTVIAQGNAVMEGIVKQYLETAVPETKTDVKDTENTTDGTDNIEDAATEKSSKKA